jgi:hypothetical protein
MIVCQCTYDDVIIGLPPHEIARPVVPHETIRMPGVDPQKAVCDAVGPTQSKRPVLPLSPVLGDVVRYLQVPSSVGVNRILKELPPSQKPLTCFVTPLGPTNVAVTPAFASVYQYDELPLEVRFTSTVDHLGTSAWPSHEQGKCPKSTSRKAFDKNL